MKKFAVVVLAVSLFLVGERIYLHLSAAAQAGRTATVNGDANADGKRDISDAVHLLNWLFGGGPEPAAFADSPEVLARLGALEETVARLAEGTPGADPIAKALEDLTALGGAGFEVWNQPLWAYRLAPPNPTARATLEIAAAAPGEVLGFRVDEAMSSPTRLEVIVETAAPAFDPSGLAGAPLLLAYERSGRTTLFHGLVSQVELAGRTGDRTQVRIVAYSRLHRLTRGKNSRTFVGKTVPEIVAEVLDIHDVDFELRLERPVYPKRELVVQYRESDLAFLSRLMEEEGMYYFVLESDAGVVRFGDGVRGRVPPTGGQVLAYYGHRQSPRGPGEESIFTLHPGTALFAGSATVGANDFEMATPVLASATSPDPLGAGEDYEFGGAYPGLAPLRATAAIRLEEHLAGRNPAAGTSNAGDLHPGHEVEIGGADRRFNGNYLVTSVTHRYTGAGGQGGYVNQFTCIPAALPFRPRRVTPRPSVGGLETAVVLAPAGEEIYTDKYGRVKVKFHWDRQAVPDASNSAWIRVGQPAAGLSSGMFFLPEVDDEVLVAFESGDPSRPYIVGSLWNGKNTPPQNLPTEKDRKVIRSALNSRPPNEIRFDDRDGLQALELHSPRALLLAAPNTTIAGQLVSNANADPRQPLNPGQRFRDNAIVAWARVDAAGKTQSELGVEATSQVRLGWYHVVIEAAAATAPELIPMAVAEVAAQPPSLEAMRFVSVQQEDRNAFNVFVNDGAGRPAASAFVFLATAR
jgi:type VI secretion system VgrG family protein